MNVAQEMEIIAKFRGVELGEVFSMTNTDSLFRFTTSGLEEQRKHEYMWRHVERNRTVEKLAGCRIIKRDIEAIETRVLDKILLQIFMDKWNHLRELDEITSEFPMKKAGKMLRKYKRVCRLNSAYDIRQNIVDLIISRCNNTAFSVFDDIIDAIEFGLDSDWDKE